MQPRADKKREELIQEMKTVFGSDQRRIDHALAVLGYAEQINSVEGGDKLVVTAAGILHDIGILQAERKHGSSAGKYQQIEGPPIARTILERLGFDADRTDHICRIVGSHHTAHDIDTIEFRVLWDADWLVNLPEVLQGKPDTDRKAKIFGIFKTNAGREMALHLLAGPQRSAD